MKRQTVLGAVLVILVFISGLVVADNVTEPMNESGNYSVNVTIEAQPPVTRVQAVQDCTVVAYQEEVRTPEMCVREYEGFTCANATLPDDSIEQTCTPYNASYEYQCGEVVSFVDKARNDCKTNALVIDDTYKLSVQDYTCLSDETGTDAIVICDSKYDGNGDGICTSGETCMKFIVTPEGLEKYEKNSRDDFLPEAEDKSFFLGRVATEVLQ